MKKSKIHNDELINLVIESDGTSFGTVIKDSMSGKVVNNVSEITIHMVAGKPNVATIKLILLPINIKTEGFKEIHHVENKTSPFRQARPKWNTK